MINTYIYLMLSLMPAFEAQQEFTAILGAYRRVNPMVTMGIMLLELLTLETSRCLEQYVRQAAADSRTVSTIQIMRVTLLELLRRRCRQLNAVFSTCRLARTAWPTFRNDYILLRVEPEFAYMSSHYV